MIRLEAISKSYWRGEIQIPVLREVNLTLAPGELVAIVGPSGSGKTSLMNILGLLDRPSSGVHWWGAQEVGRASSLQRAELRNQRLGFIFQAFCLLPRLTAWENVALPLVYRRMPRAEQRSRALASLAQLGLAEWAEHRPAQLSGGQQQRVAIARALVGEPQLILADEPTGALDSGTGAQVMQWLREIHARGTTVVLITHDPVIAQQCPRRLHIQDGVMHELA